MQLQYVQVTRRGTPFRVTSEWNLSSGFLIAIYSDTSIFSSETYVTGGA
jgi:hypothetical protein